jgi:hypothetical protein
MKGIGLDFINIGLGALNYWIWKKNTTGQFRKVNLAAAWFCGGFGVVGLIINLFKLALSLNETM